MPKYASLKDRLQANITQIAMGYEPHGIVSPCWLWLGATCNKGYARINLSARSRGQRAHIVSYETYLGRKIRDGYTLDHLCRVKSCINPAHLEEVERSVNTLRAINFWRDWAQSERGRQYLEFAQAEIDKYLKPDAQK
jgi:hypothetical protein